ncbi:MAG: protein kinase [Candidatus Riflebacteria bacterium]|nr:protein kinase [Candidatus Riflebacteria bacterium]
MSTDPVFVVVGVARGEEFLRIVRLVPDAPGAASTSALGAALVESGLINAHQLSLRGAPQPREALHCCCCDVRFVRLGPARPSMPCPICADRLVPVPDHIELDPFARWLLESPKDQPAAPPEPPPVESTDRSRQRWGPYELESRLGSGGMGIVLRAFDTRVRRAVALKVLRETSTDPDDRERFILEARVMGQLEHPNIVPVHELVFGPDGAAPVEAPEVGMRSSMESRSTAAPAVGPGGTVLEHPRPGPPATPESPDRPGAGPAPAPESTVPLAGMGVVIDRIAGPCFAMKLVRGWSLQEILEAVWSGRPGPASPGGTGWTLRAFLDVFLKVCDAVAFAHSRGILHRDLKPANVMIGSYGEVLVMDWGLAKVLGSQDRRASPTADDRQLQQSPAVTQEGYVLGTPSYMSPEQARGDVGGLDPRSDVYSLGAILYEILTGHAPFEGPTAREVLLKAQDGEVLPPSRRVEGKTVPREMEQLVLKCLAPAKEGRYATVQELAADVRRFLEGGVLTAVRYGPLELLWKWTVRHKTMVIPAALFLVAALGFYLYWITRPGLLVLETVPNGATVTIGEVLRATTPLVKELPAGSHRMTLALDGYHDFNAPIWIGPRSTSRYTLPLVSREGILALSSTPGGATVTIIDAQRRAVLATRTTTFVVVQEGTGYSIEFSHPGHVPATLSPVNVVGNRVLQRYHGLLVRDSGSLRAEPTGGGVQMTIHEPSAQTTRTYSLPVIPPPELTSGPYRLTFTRADSFVRRVPVRIVRGIASMVTANPAELPLLCRFPARSRSGSYALPVDLDGDGRQEIVACDAGDEVVAFAPTRSRVLWRVALEPRSGASPDPSRAPSATSAGNPGEPTAGRPTDPSAVSGLASGDLDSDGVPDVVMNAHGATVALSGRDGRRLFRVSHPNRTTTSPAIRAGGDAGQPIVLVTTEIGELVALDGRSGSTAWRTATGTDRVSSPTVGDLDGDGAAEVVVATVQGDVAAFSCLDGRSLWRIRTGSPIAVQPLVVPTAASGAVVVTFSRAGAVTAHQGRSGRPLWRRELRAAILAPGGAWSTPDRRPGLVVATDDQYVHALDLSAGQTLWSRRCAVTAGTAPAVSELDGDGVPDIVISTLAQGLTGLSGRDGQTLFAAQPGGQSALKTTPALGDLDGDGVEDLVVGSSDHLFALSPAPGWERWSLLLPHDLVAIRAVVVRRERWLVCLTKAGDLFRVDGLTGAGTRLTRSEVANPTGLAVLATPDGPLTVVTGPGGAVASDWGGRTLWSRKTVSPELCATVWAAPSQGGFIAALGGPGGLALCDGATGHDLAAPRSRIGPVLDLAVLEGAHGSSTLVVLNGGEIVALPCREGFPAPPLWRARASTGVDRLEPLTDVDRDGQADLLVRRGSRPVAVHSGRTGAPVAPSAPLAEALFLTPVPPGQADRSVRLALLSTATISLVDGATGSPVWSGPLPSRPVAAALALPSDRHGPREILYPGADGRIVALGGGDGAMATWWSPAWPAVHPPIALDIQDGEPRFVAVGRSGIQCFAVKRASGESTWSLARARTWRPGVRGRR